MSARKASLFTAVVLGLLALPGAASAAPVLEISPHHAPTRIPADSFGAFTFIVSNIGTTTADAGYSDNGTPEDPTDDTLSDPITVDVQLPPGVTTRLHNDYSPEMPGESVHNVPHIPPAWDCSGGEDTFTAGKSSAHCEMTIRSDFALEGSRPKGSIPPGQSVRFLIFVQTDETVSGSIEVEATASGGGADPVAVVESAPIGSYPTEFGVEDDSYFADGFDGTGVPERQAGAHPFRATSSFDLQTEGLITNDYLEGGTLVPAFRPVGSLHSVGVKLPKGFAGAPGTTARCTSRQLSEASAFDTGAPCPPASQVGILELLINSPGGPAQAPAYFHVPLYNMVPPPGAVADLGASVGSAQVRVRLFVDPQDFSVHSRVIAANEFLTVQTQRVTIWGVPGDPLHDGDRWNPLTKEWGSPFGGGEPKPFISLPTRCGVAESTAFYGVSSWQNLGVSLPPKLTPPTAVNGCNRLDFRPTISARPTTNLADTPSGLEFEMRIPQSEDPEGLATAQLRDVTVKLPEGMTVNPPSADGLGACSMEQLGITPDGVSTSVVQPNLVPAATEVKCPDASKLGTVEAISPALDRPLPGAVYLAEQGRNPFGSLLAMYLVLGERSRGAVIKLAGKVEPDPQTGQLTATFKNNPQLPLEELRMKLKEGPRAALKTPAACGTYVTRSTLTPWTSPEGGDATPQSSFELVGGPSGGGCLPGGGSAPNGPAFSAGTVDPAAKAYTPFVMRLARADGSQPLRKIDVTLPEGLVGKLAGTSYCPESALAGAAGRTGKAEQAGSSCPASSRVGSVDVGAGAGSTPLHVSGSAYLAGPYKGAPLSLAIVTPAVAGPFDLGTVVVRSALRVDPVTTQIKAVSDPLPTILEGIPLNIRSVTLRMDRPEFILNPTSCDPMAVLAGVTSVFDQVASLNDRFQVGECNKLDFKPTLSFRLKGSTKRSGHPALTAVLTQPPAGQANIDHVTVTLPRSQFLDQSRIGNVCTRPQFAAGACPANSVLGTATAYTPLLDQPLSGQVYLRANGGERELPDMVAALRGQIDVDLVGYIDAKRKKGTEISRIRNTFALVPDAPVSKFVLQLNSGKKALLENSANLCRTPQKAEVQMGAQNGTAYDFTPEVKNDCGKKAKKGKKGKPGKSKGARG
ncbi:MAG TPA: hypothetical protein VFX85_02335 [Solirubrobacterales bacterium]|nr:hypothetical protein [Solirubrobacterales bacterium]